MAREKTAHKRMAHRRENPGEAGAGQPSREGTGQPSSASDGQRGSGQPSSARAGQQLPKNRGRIRSMLQLALTFVLVGALIAAAAFLPVRIAEAFDSLFLRKVEVQTLAPEDETSLVVAPLVNRLKLLSAPHFELAALPLQTGGYLDEKTVRDVLDRELEDLNARGLYPAHTPFEVSKADIYVQVSLYVLAGQPNINGIIWTINFQDEQRSVRVCLDDESEKILSYSIRYNYAYSVPIRDLFTEKSGERWMDYLGLDSDKLRLLEETDEPSANGAESTYGASAVSLGDSLVFDKTDGFVGGVPEKRFRFLFEAGSSSLEVYFEQFNNDLMTAASLRIVSPEWEGAFDASSDKGDTSTPVASGEITGSGPFVDKPATPNTYE